MTPLEEVLERLVKIRKAIPEADPGYLYPTGDPNPPATLMELRELEHHLGRKLPTSLRALLSRCNGWPEFFQHTHLLGTSQMISSLLMDDARETLQICMDEVGPVDEGAALTSAIVFGVRRGEDLWFFNPLKPTGNGDMEVVWWHNGVIHRQDTLAEFLEDTYRSLANHWRQGTGQEYSP